MRGLGIAVRPRRIVYRNPTQQKGYMEYKEHNLEKPFTQEEKEQHELDLWLMDFQADYLRLFKFNWFEEAFFYVLMVSVLVLSWYGWVFLILKQHSYTLEGVAIYVGCAAGAIFSLMNLLKYISNQRHMWRVRKETERQHKDTKARMEAYYAKAKRLERKK